MVDFDITQTNGDGFGLVALFLQVQLSDAVRKVLHDEGGFLAGLTDGLFRIVGQDLCPLRLRMDDDRQILGRYRKAEAEPIAEGIFEAASPLCF